jgi:hypothetical protein
MEELIKTVTEKAGISPEQAKSAISAISGFLKNKMPGGIGEQVSNFLEGKGGDLAGMAGTIKDKIGL